MASAFNFTLTPFEINIDFREVASMSNDVFISCKTHDEHGVSTKDAMIAAEVYRFLTDKGLSVFLSTFTLEQRGTSAYTREIDSALESATVLLAIGTSADHLNARWVWYEWDSFSNAVRSGSKPNGKVFTYIEGMAIKDLPWALRHTHSFVYGASSLESIYNFINNALPVSTKTPAKAETFLGRWWDTVRRREREDKKRLEAERRQREDKERVEAERRQRELSAKPTVPVAVVTPTPAIITTPSATTKEQPSQNSLGKSTAFLSVTPLLVLKGLDKRFGATHALKAVDLIFEAAKTALANLLLSNCLPACTCAQGARYIGRAGQLRSPHRMRRSTMASTRCTRKLCFVHIFRSLPICFSATRKCALDCSNMGRWCARLRRFSTRSVLNCRLVRCFRR